MSMDVQKHVPPPKQRRLAQAPLHLESKSDPPLLMSSEVKKQIPLEIAHVLFIDIVGSRRGFQPRFLLVKLVKRLEAASTYAL
jgi:hypothetical protein